MMNGFQRVLFLIVFQLSVAGHAEEKKLDLNVDSSAFYRDESNESSWYRDENYQSPERKLSNQCQELMKEIKALKGRPQQRFTLQQRYESDCLR